MGSFTSVEECPWHVGFTRDSGSVAAFVNGRNGPRQNTVGKLSLVSCVGPLNVDAPRAQEHAGEHIAANQHDDFVETALAEYLDSLGQIVVTSLTILDEVVSEGKC